MDNGSTEGEKDGGKHMENKERRDTILNMLQQASKPVTGTEMAKACQVSRQIIVGDIALLRASGTPIISTPRGYQLHEFQKHGIQESFLCRHGTDQVEAELNAIVDNGGVVHNVVVEHEVYGFMEGELNLRSRRDVQLYIQQMKETKAPLLSSISNGVHTHLVETETEEEMEAIHRALEKLGILVK